MVHLSLIFRHRHHLGAKEVRCLIKDLFWLQNPNSIIEKGKNIEVAEILFDSQVYMIESIPVFFKIKNVVLPTLIYDMLLDLLPSVVVDMGAVPHVCNGADIMVPGIVEIHGTFEEGSFVVVRDEKFNKPLAISTAFYGFKEFVLKSKGKVFKNNHFVGDPLWQAVKKLEN